MEITESMDMTEVFLRTAGVAEDLVGDQEVERRWGDSSALQSYTVGGLAAHLARAVLTVDSYLQAAEPPQGWPRVDPAGYFVSVLGDHEPVDSDLHRGVRRRADEAAADGPAAVRATMSAARERLRHQLEAEPPGRRVQVHDGLAIRLDDYLRTRLVELVVHSDDLAVSVDTDSLAISAEAYAVVARVLAGLAAAREGGLATMRSLARRERRPEAVRAL